MSKENKLQVFAGNHFPSWYNNGEPVLVGCEVFAGNHFPSWYNRKDEKK